MEKLPLKIPGAFRLLIKPPYRDERGVFVKTFQAPLFESAGLSSNFPEDFISFSNPRVLRGLHFQTPPQDHDKLVTCLSGAILDVLVDLRRDLPTYGQHEQIELTGEGGHLVYIPRGVAHGFYVTSPEGAWVSYKTSTVHAPEHDAGILWSSCGIAWPDAAPIVSARDAKFPQLSAYASPFGAVRK